MFEKDEDGALLSRKINNTFVLFLLKALKLNVQYNRNKTPKILAQTNSNKGEIIQNTNNLVFPNSKWSDPVSAPEFQLNGVVYEDVKAVLQSNILGLEVTPLTITKKVGYIDISSSIKIVVSDALKLDALYEYLTIDNNRITIFVNGYRNNVDPLNDPNNKDFDPNLAINIGSSYLTSVNEGCESLLSPHGTYWVNVDSLFISRLKPSTVIYFDGHNSITSSNHYKQAKVYTNDIRESKCNFITECISSVKCNPGILSDLSIYLGKSIVCADPIGYTCESLMLDTIPNVSGFQTRYQLGNESGRRFMEAINNGFVKVTYDANGKITTQIDVVVHSMGYAHSQGMLDYLKPFMQQKTNQTYFGRYYIIAPENACSATTFDKTLFEEVWQYGSDEGLKN